nr:hypothetical protein [Tanacetum cinerariifolium]
MGTVEDYQREFEMLIKRVTIPESLLKSFYISELKLDLQCLLLRSNPKSLDETFSLARVAETRFANLDEDKEYNVEKKIDVIPPLQGVFASPKAKGSLNIDEYIGVEEVVSGGEALGISVNDDLSDTVIDMGDDSQFLIIGHVSPCSLQLWGRIGKGDVHVLIDNGSKHNFIRYDVVKKLCLTTHFMKVFKVYIDRGETLLCENMCAHVASEIQGNSFGLSPCVRKVIV